MEQNSTPAADLSFNPDKAQLDAAPFDAPCVFDSLRAPCHCGRHFRGERFAFFDSILFIYGTCVQCGPRRAIFAPPVTETEKAEQQALAPVGDAALSEAEAKALDDFLAYVRETDAA